VIESAHGSRAGAANSTVSVTAEIEPSADQLDEPWAWHVGVRLRNDGEQPVRLSTATMLGPVSFELLDEDGQPVPLGPPPAPPGDLEAGLTTIPPGETVRLDYRGDELLAQLPPPGRYRLRFVGPAPPLGGAASGRIESPWVDLTIG
jgi:hypothetical protein